MTATASDRDAATLRELAEDDRLSEAARRVVLLAASLGEGAAALDGLADVLHHLRGLDTEVLADLLEPPPDRQRGRAELPQAERHLLARAGIPEPTGTHVPALAGRVARLEFEQSCLDAAGAARHLDVDRSRVRQLLGERRLLGFHAVVGRRRWLLPGFQFDLGLVGLDAWTRLLRALPDPDATSPTALVAWLTDPRAHLDGRSRAQALLDGFQVEHLAAEAGAFGIAA